MVFLLRTYGQAVSIDPVPELLPAPLAEHKRSQAQDNARAQFAPGVASI
jgi:hypothetical protein